MTQPNDLPPLPEPDILRIAKLTGFVEISNDPNSPSSWWASGHHDRWEAFAKIVAQEAAEAAVERERARCVAICGEIMQEELDRRQRYASSVAAICGLRISNPSFQIK